MQLTDYLGTAGGAVELLVTENNSVNTNPGKQTTSLVNGLYLADSVGNLMQTEFNSLIWWDLHNSPDAGNNNAASLYGWRQYGDYGIENGDGTSLAPAHDPYPTYYAMKLLTHFARGGDSVVKATSDNTLLSVFAAKRADGTLSILVINKDPKNTLSGNFTLTGYAPQPTAAVYTYGMVQDTAAQTGSGSSDLAVTSISSAGTSFAASFSPYSLTVLSLSVPSNSPTATSQPASQTVAAGATVVFGFAASGSPLPTYQWFLNGSAVSGATGSTLVVHGAGSADAGTYTAVATNSSGSVTSSPATLAVVTTANPGRLVNLSCRADAGTGANIIVAGFAVGGAGTSGSENLLIRASGPAIAGAPFNVAGTLPDPQLELFNPAGTLTNTNEGWGGSSLISSTAAAVGAFAWSNPSSHDAAFLMPLAAGTYSTQIAGQSGDTGVAIVEVYDATPAGTYTAATPRLVNLSARVNVGTGANILVAGFAIGGTTSRTVLIRASGPAIAVAPFNVGGTLPDPQLTLMNQNTGAVIATNSGWGGDATIAATASSVGAFGWGSPTSKDSALLVTLPPGTYGAQVVGASGDTGVAIVEIYEVP
jgi:hypothetical protein